MILFYHSCNEFKNLLNKIDFKINLIFLNNFTAIYLIKKGKIVIQRTCELIKNLSKKSLTTANEISKCFA